jgi:hypothetical protein
MGTELKQELLHQLTLRRDRCTTVSVHVLAYFTGLVRKFGTPTKLDIRKAIMELHDEHLIKCIPLSDNVYDIYRGVL